MSKQPGILGSLRNPVFRALWVSAVISNTGGMIQQVGAAWMMTLLTSSQGMVALVQAAVTMPIMVVSIAAGVLADNYERRTVLLCAQAFMLIMSILLTGLAFAGLLTPWLLLTFTFLIGCGMGLHNPSWQASFSELVPREDLPSAVAMNAMGMNVTRSVGPALGGVITATLGAAAAFAMNALTYFVLIGALLSWKPIKRERTLPRERFLSALVAGLRYMMLSPEIMAINLRGFVFGAGAISMQALLPLVARDALGGGAQIFGILLGAFGLGAVVGALNAARVRARMSNENVVRAGSALFALCCIMVAVSQSLMLSVLVIFISGTCWLNVNSLLNVSVQLASPRWVLGRMIAIFMSFIFGGMAMGSWLLGWIAETQSLTTAFFVAAGILVVSLCWGLFAPLQVSGDLNLDPVDRHAAHALKLDLNRRSGPILIMVHYKIAQADVTAFLALIAERRRVHMRDGARRWTLLRDLENPDIWIESYSFPTWTEYLRHTERRTKADDDVIRRLLALHCGPEPVRAQRTIERQTVVPLDDMPRIDGSLGVD
jgi:MFS family permease|tara:strand:- start:35124 stop:36755 length:1632 start_codon:yes stop_codon:yes gene_type:complete